MSNEPNSINPLGCMQWHSGYTPDGYVVMELWWATGPETQADINAPEAGGE
jgi:hypothetical protein